MIVHKFYSFRCSINEKEAKIRPNDMMSSANQAQQVKLVPV